jgi:hypothetical protein
MTDSQFVAVIGVVNTVVLTIGGYYLAKLKSDSGKMVKSAEDTKAATVSSAADMKGIHVAVNSERKALTDKVDALHETNTELTRQLAVLLEREAAKLGDPAITRARAESDIRADARADARTLAKADEIAGRERDKPALKPGWEEHLPPDKAHE